MHKAIKRIFGVLPVMPPGLVSWIVVVSFLAISSRSFGAQTIAIGPDPDISSEGFVDYSGHYGEVFKLLGGWKVDGSMQGEAEVIKQYPPFRIDLPDSFEPFNPSPADFVPANYTQYALIQLVIQPLSRGTAWSTDALKQSRIRELQSAGVDFQIIDRPFFGGFTGDWPTGTFEILIDAPYRLSELYIATPSYLCILTGGRDTPPSTVIGDHYDWVRSGLRDWVVSMRQFDARRPARPTPVMSGLAAEVLSYLKETKEYRELNSFCENKNAADRSWSESEQGQAVAAQIKVMLDDAASTGIVSTDNGMALQYSVGGKKATDTGILVADLKSDKNYREFIAKAIATNISTNGKIQAFLLKLHGQGAAGMGASSPLTPFRRDAAAHDAYVRSEKRMKIAIDDNHRAAVRALRRASEFDADGNARELGN